MTTFDSWEAAVQPPEDYLMHFRTKGSKNGVRRYQKPDGTWTPLGLKERAEREGWGDSRKERRLQKKIARAENKQARKAYREQKRFERAEIKRKKSLSGLTDEEMAAKLKRAKMEAEYKELTKKNHAVLETGAKVVTKILDYKQNKEMRVIDLNKQKLELIRLKTEQMKAKEQTKQAKEASIKAKYDERSNRSNAKIAEEGRKQMEADVKGGLAVKRQADLKRAKKEYRETTIGGAIGKLFNNKVDGSKEANKSKKETDTILRNERKVAKYNAGRGLFNPTGRRKGAAYVESERNKKSREQSNKDTLAVRIAKENTERTKHQAEVEKYKAEQEREKTRGGR